MTLDPLTIGAISGAAAFATGTFVRGFIDAAIRSRKEERRLLRFAQTPVTSQAEDAISLVYAHFPTLPALEYVIVNGPEGGPATLRVRDKAPGIAVMSDDKESFIRWDVTRFGDAARSAILVSGVPSAGIVVSGDE